MPNPPDFKFKIGNETYTMKFVYHSDGKVKNIGKVKGTGKRKSRGKGTGKGKSSGKCRSRKKGCKSRGAFKKLIKK